MFETKLDQIGPKNTVLSCKHLTLMKKKKLEPNIYLAKQGEARGGSTNNI